MSNKTQSVCEEVQEQEEEEKEEERGWSASRM
jgi:hypothetical protein